MLFLLACMTRESSESEPVETAGVYEIFDADSEADTGPDLSCTLTDPWTIDSERPLLQGIGVLIGNTAMIMFLDVQLESRAREAGCPPVVAGDGTETFSGPCSSAQASFSLTGQVSGKDEVWSFEDVVASIDDYVWRLDGTRDFTSTETGSRYAWDLDMNLNFGMTGDITLQGDVEIGDPGTWSAHGRGVTAGVTSGIDPTPDGDFCYDAVVTDGVGYAAIRGDVDAIAIFDGTSECVVATVDGVAAGEFCNPL